MPSLFFFFFFLLVNMATSRRLHLPSGYNSRSIPREMGQVNDFV